uniref:Uncharacterized protein n=1 Tax=Oryza barthii TaxID=65489 RepID=A0A0D3G5H8_9ORYZ
MASGGSGSDREAPRDYVVAYPAFLLGGGGLRWHGDELPRQSAAAMVAAALRSRGHQRDFENGFMEVL